MHCKARNPKLIRIHPCRVQESQWGRGSHLRVVRSLQGLKPFALSRVVVERHAARQIRATVQGARPLAVVVWHEGVLPHPVRAGGGLFQAFRGAVTRSIEAILEEEVQLGDDSRYVDTLVVSDAAALLIWSLQGREAGLGYLVFTDGPVGVAVEVGKDVGILVKLLRLRMSQGGGCCDEGEGSSV